MPNDLEGLKIKIATVEDLPTILGFRQLMFAEMGVPLELFIDNLQEALKELYETETKRGRMCHFILYDSENKPVAVMGSLLKEDFPYFLFKPGFYGWIIDAYTIPEYRRRGLASELLELNKNWLSEKGIKEIKLIASGSDARRIYERFGFRATNEMSYNFAENKSFNDIVNER